VTDILDLHLVLSPMERAARQERLADLAEEKEAERQRTERAERREAMIIANALQGDPLTVMSETQARMAACQDRVNELRDQRSREERRLADLRSGMAELADRHLVVEDMAQRSAPLHGPVYAALQRGREELRRSVEAAAERRAEVDGYRRRLAERTGWR
jgi:hypothetical protein